MVNMCILPRVNFAQAPLGEKKSYTIEIVWGRMDMLRQWVLGSIFTTWFQREEGRITHLFPLKCHQSLIY